MTREEFEKWLDESVLNTPYWLTCVFTQGEYKWFVCEAYTHERHGYGGYKYISGACCSEESAVRWWRRYKKCDKPLRTMSFRTLTK